MDQQFVFVSGGFVAGGINALAGGGSFVTLPVLIACGVPSVSANATSSVALYPGGASSAWVYREALRPIGGVRLWPMFAATLLGGLIGALLLLSTPTRIFDQLLPWLLLIATIVLAFGARFGPILRQGLRIGRRTVIAVQFMLGIYGGYFGGAVGLMMMAAWSLLHNADIKTLNATRALMVTAANGIAVLCFAMAGAVRWDAAVLVGIGALVGGYAGAHLGRVLPHSVVRAATLTLSVTITILLFVRAHH